MNIKTGILVILLVVALSMGCTETVDIVESVKNFDVLNELIGVSTEDFRGCTEKVILSFTSTKKGVIPLDDQGMPTKSDAKMIDKL